MSPSGTFREFLAPLEPLERQALSPLTSLNVIWIGAARNRTRAGVEILLDVLAAPDDSLGQIRRDGFVFLALCAERVGQHVVALVALVGQEHVSGRRSERQRERERLDVSLRF